MVVVRMCEKLLFPLHFFYYLYRHKSAFTIKLEIAIFAAIDEPLVMLNTTIALK